MAIHPARQIWQTIEPLHDVTYFSPAVREAGKAIGLKGYWMTYFAFRAAPLGAVDAATVRATFASFAPTMVDRAIPDAWSRATPQLCLETRSRVSADTLREFADPAACARAVELLAPVNAGLDITGRPLGGANAALALPDDPVAALWQLTATLREHRGDGHIAALVSAGISGREALVLQVAAGRYPVRIIQSVRGWSDTEWAETAGAVMERGLTKDSALTDAGRSLLDEVEKNTDDAAWSGGLSRLGADGVSELLEILEPAVHKLWASGMVPEVNPIGIPKSRMEA
jgi:hypothetical protein